MKVTELIELLKSCPQDYEIYIGCTYDYNRMAGGTVQDFYIEDTHKTVYLENYDG